MRKVVALEAERCCPLRAIWQIWYQDSFDLACPRQKEVEGCGLRQGLVELWRRHLYETIQPDETIGFSRFDLWWVQMEMSIRICGDLAGQAKIRRWVWAEERRIGEDYFKWADLALLNRIAQAHCSLLLINKTSEPLVSIARKSKAKDDFLSLLKDFQ